MVREAGEAGHAGATPVYMRRDALGATAQIVQAVQRIGRRRVPYGRGTVGIMRVSPGSPNVVPDEVFFTVDLRHPEADILTEMDAELRAAADEAPQAPGTSGQVARIWYNTEAPPVGAEGVRTGRVR